MPNKEEKFNELWGGIIDPKIKSYSTESEIWEEFPVDIGTFIDSPDFLDWKKNIYYGVRKNLENIFVFDKNYDLKYNHAIIIESPGTGKSEFSAIASMYMVYRMLCMRNPQRFYGIAPGSRIQIVNCSSSGTQAKKVVFDYAKSKADSMKWLKDREYLPNPRVESELQFPKGIYITPGSSTGGTALGTNLLIVIMDEVSDFLRTREKNSAEDLYKKFMGRAKGRFSKNKYLFVLISAPKYDDDFIERKFKDLEHVDNALTVRRAHWEARPDRYSGKFFDLEIKDSGKEKKEILSVPVELKGDFDGDIYLALRDWASRPSRVIKPYFPDFIKIYTSFPKSKKDILPEIFDDKGALLPIDPSQIFDKLPPWFRGVPGQIYYLFTDLSKGVKAKCGLSLVHRGLDKEITRYTKKGEKAVERLPIIMVDLVTRFSAAVGNEIDFGDVRSFIAKLKTERGFNIKMVGTDSWQSYDFRAIMGKMGFQVALLQIEGDHSVYQTFKSVITDERMQGYYRESLVQELNNLEENAGKAVSRSYKDQCDSLCGATCMAIRDTFLPLKSQGASQERVQKGVLGKGLSGLVSPSSGASGGSSRKIGGPNIAH